MAEVASLLHDRVRGDTVVCGRTEEGAVECSHEGGVPWGRDVKSEPFNAENLGGLRDVVQLDAMGERYEANVACALTKGGAVLCWGDNEHGQLGDGTTTARLAPAPVRDLPPVIQIGVASRHACALSASGEVYCWGSNEHGAIASGAPGLRASRVRVAFP